MNDADGVNLEKIMNDMIEKNIWDYKGEHIAMF